jgi:hypothetical protein
MVHDNAEKASAFHGICKVVLLNPKAVVPYLESFLDAILRWDVNNQPEMRGLFLQVILEFLTSGLYNV